MIDRESPHVLIDVRLPVELDICQLPRDSISILCPLLLRVQLFKASGA